MVSDSHLVLDGGENVGAVAFAEVVSVTDASVNVTASTIDCAAASNVGIIGTGVSAGNLAWSNVRISAALVTVTLTANTAGTVVGILGSGNRGDLIWTNVSVSVTLVNVTTTTTTTATATSALGVLGTGCLAGDVSWHNVAISAASTTVTMTASGHVGILGSYALCIADRRHDLHLVVSGDGDLGKPDGHSRDRRTRPSQLDERINMRSTPR